MFRYKKDPMSAGQKFEKDHGNGRHWETAYEYGQEEQVGPAPNVMVINPNRVTNILYGPLASEISAAIVGTNLENRICFHIEDGRFGRVQLNVSIEVIERRPDGGLNIVGRYFDENKGCFVDLSIYYDYLEKKGSICLK